MLICAISKTRESFRAEAITGFLQFADLPGVGINCLFQIIHAIFHNVHGILLRSILSSRSESALNFGSR